MTRRRGVKEREGGEGRKRRRMGVFFSVVAVIYVGYDSGGGGVRGRGRGEGRKGEGGKEGRRGEKGKRKRRKRIYLYKI